jgi:hypothetical protein
MFKVAALVLACYAPSQIINDGNRHITFVYPCPQAGRALDGDEIHAKDIPELGPSGKDCAAKKSNDKRCNNG